MKTFVIQLIVLVLVIFVAFMVATNPQLLNFLFPRPTSDGGVVPIDGNAGASRVLIRIIDGSSRDPIIVKAEIKADVADDKNERSEGLSGREQLATDSGMLFIFEKSDKYKFWMKGIKIPLDFIWVLDDRVVDVLPNIPPPDPNTPDSSLPVYGPLTKVDKVIEVNGGFVSTHNIRVGDKIQRTNN